MNTKELGRRFLIASMAVTSVAAVCAAGFGSALGVIAGVPADTFGAGHAPGCREELRDIRINRDMASGKLAIQVTYAKPGCGL